MSEVKPRRRRTPPVIPTEDDTLQPDALPYYTADKATYGTSSSPERTASVTIGERPDAAQQALSARKEYASERVPYRVTEMPPRMERARSERRSQDINRGKSISPKVKRMERFPRWLTVLLVVTAFCILAMIAAQQLMQAYLKTQSDAREAAHQSVLDNHPLSHRDSIKLYAAENNLQPAFVAAIIMNESSFRTMAESNVGARGLMQLMPDTAQWIAGKLKLNGYTFDMMYDADSNIRFGCWYLGYLSRLFHGDPVSVAAAYHAGQGQVATWLSDPSLSPDGINLNLEAMEDGPTKTYARRVTESYGIYQVLYFEEPVSGVEYVPAV